MFGSIGISEILIIAAVALVILGPDKFPSHAKIAMRFIRDIRGYWDEAKRDLTEELKPVKKEIRELERYKPEDYLESMTADSAEDTSYDGQGYPYSEDVAGGESETKTDTAETTSDEEPKAEPGEAEEVAEGGVEGTKPYAPDTDYIDESERYPD